MAKKCEQCGGVYAKAYERCPECAPQPSVPSGKAAAELVAYVRSVYTNVPYSDFKQGWHEACDAITRLLAAPPQERVSEAMVEDVRYIVLDRNGRTVGNGYSTAKDAHAYAELCATGDFAFYIAGRPHRVIRRTVTTTDATLAAHQGTEP
jgi:hypothetical protein